MKQRAWHAVVLACVLGLGCTLTGSVAVGASQRRTVPA